MAASGGNGGGGLVCDDGTTGELGTSICTDCWNCTALGPCEAEWSRCDDSSSCNAFVECLQVCDEMGGDVESCIDDCASTNPAGSSIYLSAQTCSFCECPNACNAEDRCVDVLECDDGTAPEPGEVAICNTCIGCSVGIDAPCTAPDDACNESSSCDAFIRCDLECLNGGGDPESCFATCSEAEPIGGSLYRDLASCICAQCPNNCSGASTCEG
jgi:hypothetical protein